MFCVLHCGIICIIRRSHLQSIICFFSEHDNSFVLIGIFYALRPIAYYTIGIFDIISFIILRCNCNSGFFQIKSSSTSGHTNSCKSARSEILNIILSVYNLRIITISDADFRLIDTDLNVLFSFIYIAGIICNSEVNNNIITIINVSLNNNVFTYLVRIPRLLQRIIFRIFFLKTDGTLLSRILHIPILNNFIPNVIKTRIRSSVRCVNNDFDITIIVFIILRICFYCQSSRRSSGIKNDSIGGCIHIVTRPVGNLSIHSYNLIFRNRNFRTNSPHRISKCVQCGLVHSNSPIKHIILDIRLVDSGICVRIVYCQVNSILTPSSEGNNRQEFFPRREPVFFNTCGWIRCIDFDIIDFNGIGNCSSFIVFEVDGGIANSLSLICNIGCPNVLASDFIGITNRISPGSVNMNTRLIPSISILFICYDVRILRSILICDFKRIFLICTCISAFFCFDLIRTDSDRPGLACNKCKFSRIRINRGI